ncbi:hypothetical protein QYE76_017961, partial [Lolium multiflorum]
MPGIPRELAEHALNVDPTAKPVQQSMRRFSEPKRRAIGEEVNRLRKAGFIRELKEAEWVANPVMVPRKDTTALRMCIDYTGLNKHCPKDHFPLPRIDQIVDSTAGCDRLSFLDAYSGYNQIKLKKEDQELTAFITPHGVFCYNIGRNIEVYIDDIVVKTKHAATLIDDLRETFDNLDKYKIKLNPKKCFFGVPGGQVLGYFISARGIEANPLKIKAILDMEPPKNLHQVQQLAGRLAALSRFIAKLGEKALPFYNLMKKSEKFEWTKEAQESFDNLKKILSTSPVLVTPREKETLLMYIAATAQVFSSVLVVEREEAGRVHGVQRPVYYLSEVLTLARQRYPHHQKLAYAVWRSARKLRHYFTEHPIVVVRRVDKKSIRHLARGLVLFHLWEDHRVQPRQSSSSLLQETKDLDSAASDKASDVDSPLVASSIAMNEVRKKLFTISLSGKAAHWYKLLKNGDSLDWEDIVPLFYSKFYPPSEIHKDRNRIYNFWPHDGESIAQAWGRLKSLMLKCPIHELPGNVIIDNFYARLSFQDKTLLDTSCSGSFTRNKEEFKRDLLDRIQENTEGWENDKDRESGIIYDYKCIEAFMDTDKFRNMSATYGLDSQVAANLYKAFASHYELPKKNFDKYHEPYKDKVDSSVNKCVVIETVDHVIPEAYIEKTPFPAKMKEYSVISSAVNKSEKKPIEPEEQIKVEPAVAIVKDLVTENLEDGHIIFCEDASNIVSHPNKPKQVSVPMLSVRIGDHCYYGLCDIGASVSAIPYELYTEIMHEIDSCELEDIDVVIQLANRETISPIGIVRDVEVLCGKIKYPADFLVLGSAASDYCPIIFGRPFLNTCGAIIDCKKEKILTKFAGESYEFNFSKFTKTPYKADLPSDDFKMEQCASIVLVPNNPLQQHLENSESEVFRKERDELEEIFLRQPILKHDLPVEDLGTTPPPKEDPVFDLKPLPDNLKYAHIDDKKIYPIIISSKLSEIEEERLLEILKKHRGAIGYTLDDLKGISPSICQHAINMEDDAKPVVEHQRRLIPKMKEVVRNEVLKLLEAGIIYPIADSRWVSPVHCVPKKGGMTVVPNDNDELIPQRVVVGYRMCIDFRKVNKVFMDDFSVYGNSFDNCLRNLDKVLQRCEETNLVLNWEKCHFMVNEGIVLGHKISERGIEVDRAKVEAIEKMPYPRDVKGIRSVLGHAGFYRRFIKDFSKISKPLTNLLQKDVPFVFDDDCKEAFETLKKALTTAPVVEPPDWNLPFEIMCDASDFAVGAVLGQRVDKKLNVIHYANRKGADNPVADNLSRLENIAYDPVPVNDSFPNEQLAVIKVSSRESPWYADYANFIVSKYLPPTFSAQQRRKFFYDLRHYFWDDPHLYKEGVDGIMRRCVPEYEQQEILSKCHGSVYGGHHAGDRTAQKVLQSGFYWPTLFKDARKFILSCDECQRVGNISRRNEMPMNYTLVIEPFDCWGFDFMGPFPSSEGNTHILVAVDYVTKWVEAIPTKSADGETSLKMLLDIIFPRFGVPRYIMTDGGSHFIHGGFRKTLAKYGINHRIASAYHPQTSGQVELSNREIKSILGKTVNKSRKNWASKLKEALWAYRTAYKNPMGMSPYKMVYGKACHLPLELEHKAYWAVRELNKDPKLAGNKRLLQLSSLDEWRSEAYENAKLFKEKVKKWHDRRIIKREFNIGDKVLLYRSRLRFFAGKLLSKWEGPYVVEEV